VIFFASYLGGDMGIYHLATILHSGGTSLILLASIFLKRKARIVAQLMFTVSTIFSYVWDMINWPRNPATMSFSDGALEALLFLTFVLVPILGFASGACLWRQSSERAD
jgi:hypothetical protein